jgi:hypothetical protein
VPAVSLTERGRQHVIHGRELGPDDYAPGPSTHDWTRVLDASGVLVAMATPGRAPGALHPSIVLI